MTRPPDPARPVHDLGGAPGYGPVRHDPDEPPFRRRWEGRVFGLMAPAVAASGRRPGEFRHALERLAPRDYFDHGYYGRWLAGLELLLTEYGVLEPGELDRRLGLPAGTGPAARAGRPAEVDPKLLPDGTPPEQDGEPDGEPDGTFAGRHLARPPRFRAGDAVVTVPRRTSGHTRLPAYATGKRGVVVRHHRAEVLPDSTAHDLGERPQHVYSVGFEAAELWGAPAEPGVTVHVDLYENYLDAAPAAAGRR